MNLLPLKNYYEILGISSSAGNWEIKQAYRKMVRKFHPDFNPKDPGCEDKLKEINTSYEVLNDPKKKRDYDLARVLADRSHVRRKPSTYDLQEHEETFSREDAFRKERQKAVAGFKFFLLFSAPPALYLLLGLWEPLQIILQTFVILFVGSFYLALFFGAKALFHGATVLVIHTPNSQRNLAQIGITLSLFGLPLIYFIGEVNHWELILQAFSKHSLYWFGFAGILIILTWTFGACFRTPMALLFPFRLCMLGIFLTVIVAFSKAIPTVHKEEAFFDYLFFNFAMQTALLLAIKFRPMTRSQESP